MFSYRAANEIFTEALIAVPTATEKNIGEIIV